MPTKGRVIGGRGMWDPVERITSMDYDELIDGEEEIVTRSSNAAVKEVIVEGLQRFLAEILILWRGFGFVIKIGFVVERRDWMKRY